MVRRRRRKKFSAYTTSSSGKILFFQRLSFLMVFCAGVFLVILGRIFHLQIIKGADFTSRIQNQVSSNTEISARRGDILVKDPRTDDFIKLALNSSLNELRVDADPKVTPDKKLVADILTPLVFGREEYELCLQDVVYCPQDSVEFTVPEPSNDTNIEREPIPIFPSFEQAVEKKNQEILAKLETENRYILIKRRLSPEVSEKIQKLKDQYQLAHKRDRAQRFARRESVDMAIPDYLRGIILESKPFRYYSENELAAQIIGFRNHDGQGQYGIEGKMNTVLAGEKGLFSGRTDTRGRSIGLSIGDFQKAVDGSDIVLTIDRLIQQKVEEVLSAAVERYNADSGQIIVMNPKNGFILAMANYPTFNPNQFGNVYLKRRTTPEDFGKIFKTTPLFIKNPDPEATEEFLPTDYEEYKQAWELGFDPEFYVYENRSGPGAYVNKTIQEIYEPGSVFKPLIMAIALDEGEVRPNTEYEETEPLEVLVGTTKMPIRNADKQYLGSQTMINVLERSANLGMVFIAEKLGKAVMHENLKEFRFGIQTYIELDEEQSGNLPYYEKWSLASLYNTAFGQGISATPLQVATAWCALANGGRLPKPHIIAEIHHSDGTTEAIEPEYSTVLKAETAGVMTSMLVSAVENGVASSAKIDGYKIAGKTGTSQIAKTNEAGYEDTRELGSTITSFAGYAPAEDPQFVVLVKFDRPRYGSADNTWGSTTAAPVFKQVAEYLLDYYNVPPEF